jgi:serine/threonine protein kinase
LPLLTPPERIGTVVGARYELLRPVGEGASAVLFAARDRALGREVGVKVMRNDGALAREEQRGRFRREAQTLARLRHPNLVEVFDVGETDDGMPYVVVELLHGETLAARLERTPQLSPAETLAVTLPLMGALACAHTVGVIHRDIKPANIFLHRRGSGAPVPKLLDFGIAKLSDHGATMTDDGMTLGTPSFMAPEQARGEALGPATDVWAMGVTLYLCLAGRLPFDAPTAAGVLMQATRHGAPRLALPGLDASFALGVERALALEPSRRTPDMPALARALVVTAQRAGIAMPADADPVGLPDYRSWLSAAAGEQGTAELAAAPSERLADAAGVFEQALGGPRITGATDSSSVLQAVRRSRVRRTRRLSLALGLLLSTTAAGVWLASRSAPQARSQPAPSRAESEPAVPPAPLAPPVVPAAVGADASAPAAPLAPPPLEAEPEPRNRPRAAPRRARTPAPEVSPPPAAAPEPAPRPALKDWDW